MKILKQKRGISTIIAVLLMIVISVAAAVITYIWVMGYLGGTMSGIKETSEQGSISIDTFSRVDNTTLQVVVRNVGDIDVTVDKVYVGDVSKTFSGTATIPKESSTVLTVTATTSTGVPVTVKAVCTKGASATSTKTF